jgi:DNA-binding MarR family transcriptional regulator
MTQVTKPERPIGYWLKQVDHLLTEQINKAQAVHGVSRSEWQVLNIIDETGSASKEQIFETMQTFIDRPNLDEIITHLMERGWVEQSGDHTPGTVEFLLTEEGHRQHESILAKQKEVRQRAMQGIREEEYATVIRVLQRMASNLQENNE